MTTTPGWVTVETCPVCNHDAWCFATPDEALIGCRRDEGGSQRTDRSGVPYWFWHRSEEGGYKPGTSSHGNIPTDDAPVPDVRRYYSNDRAPVALVDVAYRALLDALTLSDAHRQKLQTERRLSPEQIERGLYRSTPVTFEAEQVGLAAVATAIVNARLPEGLRAVREERDILRCLLDGDTGKVSLLHDKLGEGGRKDVCTAMLGVPGVWRTPGGVWHFGTPAMPGMLVPSLDIEERVHALANRLDSPGAKGGRYLPPVSPKKLEAGSSSGSPSDSTAPHVLSPQAPSVLVITEGHFKAACSLAWVRATYGEDAGIVGLSSVGAHARLFELLDRGVLAPSAIVVSLDADASRKVQVAAALTTIALGLQVRGLDPALLRWCETDGKGLDDVIHRGKTATIATLRRQDLWTSLANSRTQAGLSEDQAVRARVVLANIIDRTTADPSHPFGANVLAALALLDDTTVEHARLHDGLGKLLKADAMRRLRRAIAGATKAAADLRTESTVIAPVYVEEEGCTCIVRDDARQRLANFTARISLVVVRDDGQDAQHQCVVTGKVADGRSLPALTLDGSAFGDVASWVRDSSWLGLARVEAGRDVSGHLAAAIERASTPDRATIYTHTGWRTFDGRNVFLMPEHVEGVTVALDGLGGRYHLPPPPSLTENPALMRAVRLSLDLADGLTPTGAFMAQLVLVPVMCGAYTAPLSTALEVDFTIWLSGASGGCKSGASALAMSHFGSFNYNALPLAWTTTANRIELALFQLKDVLVAVDDYKADLPGITTSAARIVQQVGNRTDRGRLNRNSGAMASRPPRGLMLSTGEELPRSVSDSTPGRLVVGRVGVGMLRKELIIDCMSEAPMYRLAMSGYVTWLAQNPEHVAAAVAERDVLATQYDKLLGSDVHARAARNLATLLAGFKTFLCFATDIGAIDAADADRRLESVHSALLVVGRSQVEATAETSPVDRYLSVVGALLSNGTRTLARRDEPLTKSDIGWEDRDNGRIYFDHVHAWHAIETWSREANQDWPYDRSSLHRTLVERGIVRDGNDPRHPGLRKVRVGGDRGKPQWVLDVDRVHLEHALRSESPEREAERRAAAEAEADVLANHINQTLTLTN